jgi:Fur family ferric uptake transcriptional regulator
VSAVNAPPARRETRQRAAVAAVLDDADGFLSAQQLHARLRAQESRVGLATVYRTLQQLCADGEIDMLRTADGESLYRRCSSEHHHHLICRSCRRSVEISNTSIEQWAEHIAEKNGFAEVEHVVELYGTCSSCVAREGSGPTGDGSG